MYINFNLLEKNNFQWQDNPVLVLQCIHQKEYERLKDCSVTLNLLWKKLFLTMIDGKKDMPNYLKVRLSDFGKRFLKDLSIAEITEDSRNLAGKLVSLYENNNLTIKNKKKVVELVSWFVAETGFDPNKIYAVVQDYISSTDKTYISNLNNLFWKGESVYSTKWQLSQSKLYGLMTK